MKNTQNSNSNLFHAGRGGGRGRTDGQTDTTQLIVAFHNFASAPKNLLALNFIATLQPDKTDVTSRVIKKYKREDCEGMVILKEWRRKDNPIMFCCFTTTTEGRRLECKNHIKCIMEGGARRKCYGCNWWRQNREYSQACGEGRGGGEGGMKLV